MRSDSSAHQLLCQASKKRTKWRRFEDCKIQCCTTDRRWRDNATWSPQTLRYQFLHYYSLLHSFCFVALIDSIVHIQPQKHNGRRHQHNAMVPAREAALHQDWLPPTHQVVHFSRAGSRQYWHRGGRRRWCRHDEQVRGHHG